MGSSITFVQTLLLGLYLIAPILLLLCLIIIILGLFVARIESWSKFDALYWAFITALTVGYGDIRPRQKLSRVLSVFIATTGIMFTGILVAITIEATSSAFEKHIKPEHITQPITQHISKGLHSLSLSDQYFS